MRDARNVRLISWTLQSRSEHLILVIWHGYYNNQLENLPNMIPLLTGIEFPLPNCTTAIKFLFYQQHTSKMQLLFPVIKPIPAKGSQSTHKCILCFNYA
jgi:hypothetical protein